MSSAARKITTETVTIQTATVEIKSLTLNNKQMTQAVFRQLKEEPLIDEKTGELLGQPWGTVNYFWGACSPNHLHIVWQKESELRRACVYQQWRLEELSKEDYRDATTMLDHGYLLWFLLQQIRNPWSDPFARQEKITVKWEGVTTAHSKTWDRLAPLRAWWDRKNPDLPWKQRQTRWDYHYIIDSKGVKRADWRQSFERPENDDELEKRLGAGEADLWTQLGEFAERTAQALSLDWPLADSVEESLDILQEEVNSWAQVFLRSKNDIETVGPHRRKTYLTLTQLPQLFIAV